MESELCHEMLRVPLQETAVAGLKTITGFDLKGWRDFKDRLVTVLNSANESTIELKKDKLHEWQDQLRKLEKFISLIPAEAGRFYDDQVQDEVQPMCETG